MFNPTPTQTGRQLLNRLLDQGYAQEAGAVVNALTRNVASGAVATRLQQLEDEARRLEAAGLAMEPDNPVLRAVMADLDDMLVRNQLLIDGAAPGLQRQASAAGNAAAKALSLQGVTDAMLAQVGVAWRTPDPRAVAELINIANSAAWKAELNNYSARVLESIQQIALRGIVTGQNPLAVARAIADAAAGLPISQAQTMMRTLQLVSYRRAVGLNYQANRDIGTKQIRIAALDGRCCLACVALHGTVLPADEAIQDHQNGRCTSILRINGLERLSQVETGEDWFARQPEEVRLAMAGPGAYEAIQSGKAQLRDFVQHYTDPVFGDMIREASLKSIGVR